MTSPNTPPVIIGDRTTEFREGETTFITRNDLYFTDADDTEQNVTFTVSNFINVTVNFNGVPVTDGTPPAPVSTFSFTAYEVRTGQISFTHTGTLGAPAGFDVIIEDGNEDGSVPTPTRFDFSVVTGNDAPVITGDLAATMSEGATVVLTGADLSFSDPDDTAANVTFTVSGLVNGVLLVDGVSATTFTGQQLQAGQVAFRHDGGETTSAQFDVSVEDGNEDNSIPSLMRFNLAVTPVNEAPVIAGDLAGTMKEGGTLILTGADLSFSDPDDTAAGVTFTVSDRVNGVVLVNGVSATTFTGQQLQAGQVAFRHNGGETTTARFDVKVEDGNEDVSVPSVVRFNLAVTPVNDAPGITGDLAGTVREGGTVVLRSADLSFSDPDDTAAGVTFTVSDRENGVVLVNGVSATTFTGQQLQAGLVAFRHDGGETTTARFNVKVEDGNEDGSVPSVVRFNLAVTPVNDAPVLTGDLESTVVEGKAVTLTRSDLYFTDVDDQASGVTFTVSGQTNGHIKLSGAVATQFTAADVAAGRVTFVHNGSETRTASFLVSADDGNEDRSTPTRVSFSLKVTPDNDKPTVNKLIADVRLPVHTDHSFAVANNFRDDGTLSFSAKQSNGSALPAWLSFDKGQFKATPPDNVSGSFTIIVTAKDTGGKNVSDTFVLTIPKKAALTSSASNGADSLTGTAGNDRAVTGFGSDKIDLGLGNDFADLGDGNDSAKGGAGDDTMYGGEGKDKLYGGIGNDKIEGNAGNDELYGDAGSDTIDGGAGLDYIEGGTGNDFINDYTGGANVKGGAGNDKIKVNDWITLSTPLFLHGDSGDDQIYSDLASIINGGSGNDTIGGSYYYDLMRGGDGNDHISGVNIEFLQIAKMFGGKFSSSPSGDTAYGEGGNDTIAGLGGDDVFYGGTGDDSLYGNEGNDNLYGDAGNDDLNGGEGSDRLFGGAGNDTLNGGPHSEAGSITKDGRDYFVFSLDAASGVDRIEFFSSPSATNGSVSYNDKIELPKLFAGSTLAAFGAAQKSTDKLIYNHTTGDLYYDRDANGTGAAIKFAILADRPVLNISDFVFA